MKEVGYEFVFAPDTFDASSWLDVAIAPTLIRLGAVHASPSKLKYSTYGEPECIVGCAPAPIPEPSSLLLFSAGLASLGARFRRRLSRTFGRAAI